MEYQFRKKSSEVGTGLCSAKFIELDGKSCMISATIDITERRKSEADVRMLVTAIEHTEEQIVVTDVHANIQYCNPAFEKVSGYSRSEVLGQNARMLKSGEHTAEVYGELWATLNEGKVWRGQLTNKKKDGSLYEEDVTISPITDVSGRITGFVAMKRDVTERRQLEAQFRQAQKLESIGRLAGGVAHEFNNLLTVINGYSDFLLKRLSAPDPLRSYAAEIRDAGRHAASLTKQLLAFSRKQVIEPKALDVNTTIRDAVPMLQRLIGEDIRLTMHLDGLLGQVMADSDQIGQVIMNLAVNARDAMPDGGSLDIETTNVELDEGGVAAFVSDATPGRYILMTVADTGHGMNETTRQQIFEPFFTTKEVSKGTGLGLSTVYGIVKQSGGWITVQSEVGAGTSLRIYFPRIDACPLPEQKGTSAPTDKGSETILLVEDQKAVRSFTKAALSEYGYHVIEAADGEEAIAVARHYSGQIHLLLTDVVLPGMNGKTVSERLKVLRRDLKVLFVSGYTSDVIGQRGVLDRGLAFLHKPFSSDELAAKVREVLGEAEVGVVTVLLVEDFKKVRELLAEILCEGGYAVVEARDGLQALERLREQPVRVALLDMNMPQMGGFAAAKKMRKQHPEIKIVLMSAAFEDGFHVNLKALGVDAVLQKPVSSDTLLDTLRRVTGFVKAVPKSSDPANADLV
jgi:two-component system cell cycle sensor histidine kinase/response regulator CckA